jgi:hypothetical protein
MAKSLKTSPQPPKPMWTEGQWATYINKTVDAVRKARMRGEGPKYYRIAGTIRYRFEDIEEFLKRNANRHSGRSTPESAA